MKLVDVLRPEFIKYPLQASSKVDVIKEMIDILSEHNMIPDKESILQAVLEREKIMTTGVGNNVAIPHCKHPDCQNFAIAMGIHPKGVDFEAIDNLPAKIIFLLVGPEDKPGLHIRLLSRISRLISKSEVREKVLQLTNPQDIYQLLKQEEEKFFEINA